RFQWPADLLTSWAFDMEALILGWYVLTATGSVQQLVLLGALAWLGTLFSPFLGAAGDQFGVRGVLCITRGTYAVLPAVLAGLAPAYVIVTLMYAAAFVLSLRVAGARAAPKGNIAAAERKVIADVKQAVRYVWHKPDLLGAISMAFLINLVAFPFGMGLLPYA